MSSLGKAWRYFLSHYGAGTFLLLVATAVVLAMRHWNIGCPIRAVFGIPCPGCGLTRAFSALIHGRFVEALYYHPLIVFVPFGLYSVFTNGKPTKSEKVNMILLISSLSLIVVVWLIRLIFFDLPHIV